MRIVFRETAEPRLDKYRQLEEVKPQNGLSRMTDRGREICDLLKKLCIYKG
jgi:hypothetical protein